MLPNRDHARKQVHTSAPRFRGIRPSVRGAWQSDSRCRTPARPAPPRLISVLFSLQKIEPTPITPPGPVFSRRHSGDFAVYRSPNSFGKVYRPLIASTGAWRCGSSGGSGGWSSARRAWIAGCASCRGRGEENGHLANIDNCPTMVVILRHLWYSLRPHFLFFFSSDVKQFPNDLPPSSPTDGTWRGGSGCLAGWLQSKCSLATVRERSVHSSLVTQLTGWLCGGSMS
jgi:hypothetical protein